MPNFALIEAKRITVCTENLQSVSCAGILEQSIGAGNRVGKGLPYRPARLHRLAESIPGLLKSLPPSKFEGHVD
jgi:hypothetical protein